MGTYGEGSMNSLQTAGRWLELAKRTLDEIGTSQERAIADAAELCATAIAAGGFAHVFGSGHSRIPVEEMFPRYGSYPGFHPVVELSMTFHTQIAGANGQRQAMFIERVEGLAEVILSNFHFKATDAMIVFSVSGASAVPIEIAMGAQQRGLPVIAVTSLDHSNASESLHPSGTRLLDHADIVIDLCTPVGDAAVAIPGLDTPVGPLSTIAAVTVANEIKVQTAELLQAQGKMPAVLTASAVVGPERSKTLFDTAYSDHARRLAAALAGDL